MATVAEPDPATAGGSFGRPVVSLAAAALQAAAEADFLTEVAPNGVAITGYRGAGGDVVIPASIGGVSVCEIRERAFAGVTSLTSVVVPGSVGEIGYAAFDGCSGIRRLVLSEGVKTLRTAAFSDCSSLQEIVLPASLSRIDAGFEDTRLRTITLAPGNTSFAMIDGMLCALGFGGKPWDIVTCLTSTTGPVTIPEGPTFLRAKAFAGCVGITSLTLPATLNFVGGVDDLRGCDALASIQVAPGNVNFTGIDGVLYDKQVTKLVRCPPAKAGALVIPATVTAFESTTESLAGCARLQSITIPAGLADLGKWLAVFSDCSRLASITVAAGHPAYTSVDGLLYDTAVTNLVLCPKGRTGTIRLPATVTGTVFALDAAPALERIEVAAGNPSYAAADGLLYDKAVASLRVCPQGRSGVVTLPATVTDASGGRFSGRSAITAIEVAAGNRWYASVDGVLYSTRFFASWELEACPEGKTGAVRLPTQLAGLSAPSFGRCRLITRIDVDAGNAFFTSVDGIVYSKDMTAVRRVPAGSTGTVALPASVKEIASSALSGCGGVSGVSLPGGLQAISEGAFRDCGKLATIAIPAGVARIGDRAFMNCTSLRSVRVPGLVTDLGQDVFRGCTSLQDAVIEGGIAEIRDGVFAECASLASIVLPGSVKRIGTWAFQGCSKLSSVGIPTGLESVGDGAFSGCERLSQLALPASVTTIGYGAFYGCTGLQSVNFGAGLTTIGESAFRNCRRLTSATLPAKVARVGDDAFGGTGIKALVFRGPAPVLGTNVLWAEDGVFVYPRSASGWTNPIAGVRAVTVADAPATPVAIRGEGRVKLSWSRPGIDGGEAAVSYRVEFSRNGGATWTVVNRLDPTATTQVVDGLQNNELHLFRVAVVNRAGVGAFAAVNATPAARPATSVAFAAPGAVAASQEDGAAVLTWTPPFLPAGGSIAGYAVEYSTNGGWTWVAGPRTTGTGTTAVVSGLTNGIPHQFRVAAFGAAGNGAFSKPTPAAVVIPGSDGQFVRLADDGTLSTQFTPDGRLARLTWERRPVAGVGFVERLVYRCEAIEQDMVEDVLLERTVAGAFTKNPMPETIARLVFAPDGTPNVLVADGTIGHYRREAGGWRKVAVLSCRTDGGSTELERFVAAVGPTGALHFVAGFVEGVSFNFDHGPLWYGTNLGGTWKTSMVVATAAVDDSIPFNAPLVRQLDLAVDAAEKAHLVYSPGFDTENFAGFTRDYSELAYATNASGAWASQIVHRPPDGTGASGFGNTIRIGPDGQPVIAQFFVDNVDTGSHVSAQLLLHRRQRDGSWTAETIASQPDGYVAGDGAKYTGFSPQIAFDRAGVPHVAFADYAAQHFPDSQYVFAGQLRHAWKEGGRWQVETLVRQSDPLNARLSYPSVAVGPGGLVFSGVRSERSSPTASSTVRQVTVAKTDLGAIESAGAVTLSRAGTGFLHANGVPITADGNPVHHETFANAGWFAVAAEGIDAGKTLLWRHSSGFLHFWRCDANWKRVKAEGAITPGSAEYAATEAAFGIDIDRDGWVGIANNRAPMAIALSSAAVAENLPAGTVVGALSTIDPDAGGTFRYTIAPDATLDGTRLFEVVGNQLRTKAAFNFEAKKSYSVRVRSTDQGGLFTGKVFTITVRDVNEAPTLLTLSAATVAATSPAGTVVGRFSARDPDAGDAVRYALVADPTLDGSDLFTIVGNELRTKTSLASVTKSSLSIRVRAFDKAGLFAGKLFTITVTR